MRPYSTVEMLESEQNHQTEVFPLTRRDYISSMTMFLIYHLKARRDQIVDVASQYYNILALRVDIVGSNKHEKFVIERLDDEQSLRIFQYR